MAGDQLSFAKKLSYGVGHVLNDLSASMWFSYLLIYLHRIVEFSNSVSGYMMLLGQIADAIATGFVGFESDRTKTGFFNYGRRKSWHLVGVISVLISFPFLFNLCFSCENAAEWARFYYYAPFVVIFQFGWAATQIAHLSLIPQLTTIENERVALQAIRYSFTVMSNLFVYCLAYLLLKFNNSNNPSDDEGLSRSDSPKFMYLSIIVIFVGSVFQIIFHVGTNEKALLNDDEINQHEDFSLSTQAKRKWGDYIRCPKFYTNGVLYMSTRLIVNMTQVYLPMYLTDTLNLDKSSIALVPLICYISGFVSTFPIRSLSKSFGSYITYFIGVVLILICSGLFWFDSLIYDKSVNTIVASIVLGSGSTIILVTSLALTTDLIGKNTGSGAFIFGAMSFTDKLSNGIVVAILQQFSPCQYHTVSCSCKSYYHNIMALLPLICALMAFGALIVLYLLRPKITESSLLVNPSNEQKNETYGTINDQEN